MKKAAVLILILLIMAGCSKNEKTDAYGTMSVSEIYPACEVTGRMISFTKNEGEKVTAGEVIALLDTTDIDLQINEMNTTINLKRMALTSRENEILILTQEKANLEIDKKRFEKLTEAQAAPEKNLDDVMAALRVMELKLKNAANTKQISNGEITIAEEKLEQLKARKEKCILRSPVSGTILEKYIHEGEMALAGKPFCSIADLKKMTAKVYVSETQLPELTIGGEVTNFLSKASLEKKLSSR